MNLKYLTPYHNAEDQVKLTSIKESMLESGWIGCPLVADGEQLLTGAHRYQAAKELGLDIPVIDIRDIFKPYEALMEEEGNPDFSSRDFVYVIGKIPNDIKGVYGIDIH